MTIDISANNPRISYSVASGVTQTSFTVPFEFFDDSDLNVYIDTTLQTITTNYTVAGGAGSTGTITMSVTGPKTVILTRDTTIERTTDFTAGVDINRAALNTQLDTLTAISADNKDLGERSIRITDYDPAAANLLLPDAATRADKLLSFDTEGDVQVQAAADLLTGSVLGANYTKASYTGNGTQTAYSTVESAGSKNNIQVYVDGVYQNKATFSISSATLTFTEAPPLNSAIEFIVGNAVTSLTTDPAVVNYNQGGAGAQDRTLTNKLQDIVSVKDFGAVGNGVTDDSAAIQAALDASNSVYIPEGTYKTSAGLTFGANHTIIGAGQQITTISGTHTGNLLEPTNLSTQARGLHFADFALTKSANTGTGNGIRLSNSRSATLSRLEITQCDIGLLFKPEANASYSYFNTFEDLAIFSNTTHAVRQDVTGTDIPNANFYVRGDWRGGDEVMYINAGSTTHLTDVSIQGATNDWIRSTQTFTATSCRFENSSAAILTAGGINVYDGVLAAITGGSIAKGIILGDSVRVSNVKIEGRFPEITPDKDERNLNRVSQAGGFRSGQAGNLFIRSNDVNNAAWTKSSASVTNDAFSDPRGVGASADQVDFSSTSGATDNYYQNISGSDIEGVRGYYFTVEGRALTGEAGSIEIRIKQKDSGGSVVERIDKKIYLTDQWATHAVFVRFAANTVTSGSIEPTIMSVADSGDLDSIVVANHTIVVGDIPGVATTTSSASTYDNAPAIMVGDNGLDGYIIQGYREALAGSSHMHSHSQDATLSYQWATDSSYSSSQNWWRNNTNGSAGGVFNFLRARQNGTSDALLIDGNGDVTNANGTYGTISDQKLKENISDARNYLDDLDQLRVRKYSFIADQADEATHLGLIAQEVEQIFPNLISEVKDVDEDGNDLVTTTKSVKFSVLTFMMLKAIQELKARIETLEGN